jgi:hypothetical protein
MTRAAPTRQDRECPFQFSVLLFSTTDRKGHHLGPRGHRPRQRTRRRRNHRSPAQHHPAFGHVEGGGRPAVRSILAGKPIVAYVPNVETAGSYDWVLAVVTPVTERFLSIALKPSTHSLEPVATRYPQLQQTEADDEAAGEGKKAAVDKARAS